MCNWQLAIELKLAIVRCMLQGVKVKFVLPLRNQSLPVYFNGAKAHIGKW